MSIITPTPTPLPLPSPSPFTFTPLSPLHHSFLLHRRRHFSSSLELCDLNLKGKWKGNRDFWYLKCRNLVQLNSIDILDFDDLDDGVEGGEEETINNMKNRPGTSIKRQQTGTGTGMKTAGGTASGSRPNSGFARPSSSSSSSSSFRVDFGSRPYSSRSLRVGTASLMMSSDSSKKFFDPSLMDCKKLAKKPSEAKIIILFLISVEKNLLKSIEMLSECTKQWKYSDWWAKFQLGKCFYLLGLMSESSEQLLSAARHHEAIGISILLSKISLKRNQPLGSLEVLGRANEKFQGDCSLILSMARCYQIIGDNNRAMQFYKKAIHYDAADVEAIANLAHHFFLLEQTEISCRMYRRLLQMGCEGPEIWNNLGLCCFDSLQLDVALKCFERAIRDMGTVGNTKGKGNGNKEADHLESAIWYNIGMVSIGCGDLSMAFESFSISLALNPTNGECLNNLGIISLRRGDTESAKSLLQNSNTVSPYLFEPKFNLSLTHYKIGDLHAAINTAMSAIQIEPNQQETNELIAMIKKQIGTM